MQSLCKSKLYRPDVSPEETASGSSFIWVCFSNRPQQKKAGLGWPASGGWSAAATRRRFLQGAALACGAPSNLPAQRTEHSSFTIWELAVLKHELAHKVGYSMSSAFREAGAEKVSATGSMVSSINAALHLAIESRS